MKDYGTKYDRMVPVLTLLIFRCAQPVGSNPPLNQIYFSLQRLTCPGSFLATARAAKRPDVKAQPRC